jgi:hypothetical protein
MNVGMKVPTLAAINHMTLMRAASTDQYQRCLRIVEQECNMPRGSLEPINFAHTISLLYCLIVIPKEVWRPVPDHEIYQDVQRERLCDHFAIEFSPNSFYENPSYHLIHHLRNAVAHARFSLDQNRFFTFWDQKSEQAEPHFRASVPLDNLGVVLAFLAKLFDRLRVGVQDGGDSSLPAPQARHKSSADAARGKSRRVIGPS